MKLTFSQGWAKEKHGKRIRTLFDKVKTCSTPDLWVKVFFYTRKGYDMKIRGDAPEPQITTWNGHYRGLFAGHGPFYKDEWKVIKKSRIRNIITLKIGKDCDDKAIMKLMAHEFAHYLQFRKGKRKKYFRCEHYAKKWANKRMEKISEV